MPALTEAGNAALAVNDLESALGFFKRLTDLEPENEAGTLGLARVYLRSGRPVMALLYFDAAQSRGAGPLAVGSDQALTYDLLGDQPSAQQAYLRLIEASPKDEEARRRLALSYAISGDEPKFETTLRPLIERRDFAAFRARTFGLAILGKQERAAAIADAVMPKALAQRVPPYLEFMPRPRISGCFRAPQTLVAMPQVSWPICEIRAVDRLLRLPSQTRKSTRSLSQLARHWVVHKRQTSRHPKP